MAEHTPGPWQRRSIPGHLFELANSAGDVVLRIRGGMMPSLADARLLEATAELADLARAFTVHAARNGGCSNCGGVPHTDTCFAGRFAALLARVDGAEGTVPVRTVQDGSIITCPECKGQWTHTAICSQGRD